MSFWVFNNSLVTFITHQSSCVSSDLVIRQFERPIIYILKFWSLHFMNAFISKQQTWMFLIQPF